MSDSKILITPIDPGSIQYCKVGYFVFDSGDPRVCARVPRLPFVRGNPNTGANALCHTRQNCEPFLKMVDDQQNVARTRPFSYPNQKTYFCFCLWGRRSLCSNIKQISYCSRELGSTDIGYLNFPLTSF